MLTFEVIVQYARCLGNATKFIHQLNHEKKMHFEVRILCFKPNTGLGWWSASTAIVRHRHNHAQADLIRYGRTHTRSCTGSDIFCQVHTQADSVRSNAGRLGHVQTHADTVRYRRKQTQLGAGVRRLGQVQTQADSDRCRRTQTRPGTDAENIVRQFMARLIKDPRTGHLADQGAQEFVNCLRQI